MAATNKNDLLAVAVKEYEKLDKLIGGIHEEVAVVKDADDTSIKDVIAHRAHWIDLFFGWYEDGLAGKQVDFPARGYKWSELKRYNADLRAKQVGLRWPDACGNLATAHGRLIGFIEDTPESDLYDGPMAGARNDWTPGRWAEAAGPSHYRSAAKYIRARLRGL